MFQRMVTDKWISVLWILIKILIIEQLRILFHHTAQFTKSIAINEEPRLEDTTE